MPAPGLPAMDNTLGALFIGVLLAMGLWGAGSVQCFYYYNQYPNDNWQIKYMVFVVWALDTTHQGLITHSAYIYLIREYGNPAYLANIVPSLLIECIISGLICLIVQLFFVLRVWRLSHKNIPTTAVLVSLVLALFVVTMVYTGKALTLKTFERLASIVNLSRMINIFGAVSDVAIAFTLIFLLQRSRTGFSRSESIINRLILFTINTGLLTSLCAVMSLVMITAYPNTFIYILFYVIVSRLYTNSLLATLNARSNIAGGLPDDTQSGSRSLPHGARYRVRTVEFDNAAQSKGNHPQAVSIKVDTETTHDGGGRVLKSSPARVLSESDSADASFTYDSKKAVYQMNAL